MRAHRLRRATKVGAAAAVSGTLLAGGLTACGQAAAQVSTKHQFAAAQSSLENAAAASFTLHLDDPNRELVAAASSASDKKDVMIAENLSMTVTVDPDGDQTIGSALAADIPPANEDPVGALRHGGAYEVSCDYKDQNVFAVRSIAGKVYLYVSPIGVKSLTGHSLNEPTDPPAGSQQQAAINAFRADKWIELDVASLYANNKDFREADGNAVAADALSPAITLARTRKLLDAVKSHASYNTVKTGDTSVVAMKIDAKAALSAVSTALTSTPSGWVPDTFFPTDEINAIPAGSVTGSMTSTNNSLAKVELNLGSVAALSKEPGAEKIKTAKLVVDVDDDAGPMQSPPVNEISPVNTVALGSELLEGVLPWQG